MSKLTMLSFEDDYIIKRKIREATNYCDEAHLHTATFGIAQLVLSELAPIDLDGYSRLTVCANVEQPIESGKLGYNRHEWANVSTYELDRETSQKLYEFKKFDNEFCLFVANLLMDILIEIDERNGGKNRLKDKKGIVLNNLVKCGFYKEIPIKRLCKFTKDKKYQGVVLRCLSQSGGEPIKAAIIKRADGEIVASEWLTDEKCGMTADHLYERAFWNGNRFHVIYRYLPDEEFYIEIPNKTTENRCACK